MCFPEEWVISVIIPMTNKELNKKMDLQEFYLLGVYLLHGVPRSSEA
jgi:hypothetical protein